MPKGGAPALLEAEKESIFTPGCADVLVIASFPPRRGGWGGSNRPEIVVSPSKNTGTIAQIGKIIVFPLDGLDLSGQMHSWSCRI